MAARRPVLHLIAGPNGSGKSTFAAELLRAANAPPFVNTDDIARALGDWRSPAIQVAAAKESLARMRSLLAERRGFVHETTLSGTTQIGLAERARREGWRVELTFVYLRDASLNVKRVEQRVKAGGHDVPEADIRRRYERSFANLWRLVPHCNAWRILDNTDRPARLIAAGLEDEQVIYDLDAFEALRRHATPQGVENRGA